MMLVLSFSFCNNCVFKYQLSTTIMMIIIRSVPLNVYCLHFIYFIVHFFVYILPCVRINYIVMIIIVITIICKYVSHKTLNRILIFCVLVGI